MFAISIIRGRLARRDRKRAKSLQAAGRWAEALPHWISVSRLQPLNAHAWLQVGNMLTELGRYDEAHVAFDNAISLGALVLGRSGHAGIHVRLGNWRAALENWDSALRTAAASSVGTAGPDLRATMADLLVQTATCRYFLGEKTLAERDFALATVLSPQARWKSDAVVLRARLLAGQNDRLAYRILKRRHALDPRHRAILYELTRLAGLLGERDFARTLAGLLVSQDANDRDVGDLIKALNL